MHREDQNLDLWHMPTDLACGFDAVDQGQSIVEDGHVGLGGNGLGDGVFAVGCFSDDAPPRLILNDAPNTRAHHVVVIGNQDAGHGRHAMRGSSS